MDPYHMGFDVYHEVDRQLQREIPSDLDASPWARLVWGQRRQSINASRTLACDRRSSVDGEDR
jgi:hypothetical protein